VGKLHERASGASASLRQLGNTLSLSFHPDAPAFRARSASLPCSQNDHSSDAERQRLLPFVTRLACADTPAIELERAAYIRSKVATAHSFEYGLKVLEGALAIGWQADTLGFDEARTRLEKVQSRASSAASVADSPIFAKVKSWLERKKQIEPT